MKLIKYSRNNYYIVLLLTLFLVVAGLSNSWLQSSIIGIISIFVFIIDFYFIVTLLGNPAHTLTEKES